MTRGFRFLLLMVVLLELVPANVNAHEFVHRRGNDVSENQNDDAQGQITIGQGQGQIANKDKGQGQIANKGQGQIANKGQGQIANKGQGQIANKGQGQIANKGQGQTANKGQGEPTKGQITAEVQKPVVTSSDMILQTFVRIGVLIAEARELEYLVR